MNSVRPYQIRFYEDQTLRVFVHWLVTLQSCNKDSSKIFWEGWIHAFVANFGVNDRQIYMALCSLFIFFWGGGLLDTGSRPIVVDD